MKTKFSTLRILSNPFPFICYTTGLLLLIKSVILLFNFDILFKPVIIWGFCSALFYAVLTTILKKRNIFILYLCYILESCLRISYSIVFTKCDPKYEILLISFFIVSYLFNTNTKKNKVLFGISLILISLTIVHTFYFKFKIHVPVSELNPAQLLFAKTEVYSNILITFIQLTVISFNSGLTLKKMHLKNEAAQKKLEYITCHDILTGLMNRYLAVSHFSSCEFRKMNENIDYAIAILDIDDFKNINDIYGHDCGDFILKSYTQELRKKLDPQIKIARWGGEEFVIIFPRLSSETVFELDTIRELLSLSPFIYNGQIIHVSATYGMSSSRHLPSAFDILNDADSNLLIGKQNGKNRLVVSQKF